MPPPPGNSQGMEDDELVLMEAVEQRWTGPPGPPRPGLRR